QSTTTPRGCAPTSCWPSRSIWQRASAGEGQAEEGARMAQYVRARWKTRERLLGRMVTLPSPPAAEVLASLGFDWLFIDAEHGPLETRELLVIHTRAHRDAC